jgi:hypothetical protein
MRSIFEGLYLRNKRDGLIFVKAHSRLSNMKIY